MSRYASSAASALLGVALAGAAFTARGGDDLTRVTAVELAVVLCGGVAIAVAATRARLRQPAGLLCAALFVLLALLTAGSIAWSVAPDLTWLEANRTIAYVAAFAGGIAAARLAPGGAPALLRAVLLAVLLVIGYSLLSRVFPAALAPDEIYARVAEPFGYWNAVGVTAALAVPAALWLGARRSGHPPMNALAYPMMGLLYVALFLSYSRGALAAAMVGTALWLVWVPLRLRSLAVLALPAAAAAPLIAWVLSQEAFAQDRVPLATREAAGGELGLLLAGMTIGLLGAGLAIGFGLSLHTPGFSMRLRLGLAALGAAAAVGLFGFASVALSERGLAGTVSARVEAVRSEQATTAGGPDRLTQASSSRAEYWRQAISVYSERPAIGAGAGSFAVARLRHRETSFTARHAHGYVVQTLADLGLAGLAVSLALALAWILAAARAIGAYPSDRGMPFSGERIAMTALALAVIVFAVQSAIDWTWFVPGPTLIVLLAAGFVAGSGRLAARRDDPPQVPATAPVTPTLALVTEPAGAAPPAPRLDLRPSLALAGAVLVTTGLCAWAVWQPARSEAHAGRALEHIEADRLPEAAREARRAGEIDPLSPRPLLVRAAVEAASGRERPALELLQQAVREHPSDPQVWLRLASFQLRTLEDPNAALETLRGALYVDPQSRAVQALYYETRAAQRERVTGN